MRILHNLSAFSERTDLQFRYTFQEKLGRIFPLPSPLWSCHTQRIWCFPESLPSQYAVVDVCQTSTNEDCRYLHTSVTPVKSLDHVIYGAQTGAAAGIFRGSKDENWRFYGGYNTLLCCEYFSLSSVVSGAFSALCRYSKFGHHPHLVSYPRAKCLWMESRPKLR